VLKKTTRATSDLKKRPTPELPKRRQRKFHLAGASPLMRERRLNSFYDAWIADQLQTDFVEII
jgi:hypothetical protein